MDMDLDFATDELLEENNFDKNDDASGFVGESCGICMDIVIDRGVLDCCQHWFCFSCIDNWATITNLCPLCQNEFQLITCVPVFDTIGSNNIDEELQLRDDDWYIGGKNNTLSFPSYYIDENAVVCLDGDGCKVRSMPSSIEEYSNLDTSIACDSCDKWYHAFCVEFDTEDTCEKSWLCPRCTVSIMQQKSDKFLLTEPSNQSVSEDSTAECFVDPALSGKVVVSVADDGETAVVVSMLEEKQKTKKQIETPMSSLEMCLQVSDSAADAEGKSATVVIEKTEDEAEKFFSSFNVPEDLNKHASLTSSFVSYQKLETPSNNKLSVEPNSVAEEVKLSLLQGSSAVLPTNSLLSNSDNDVGAEEMSARSNGFETSARKLLDQHDSKVALESVNDKSAEDRADVGDSLKTCPLQADEITEDKKKNVNGSCGTKRKNRDWRHAEGETKAKVGGKTVAKKVSDEGNIPKVHLRDQAGERVMENTLKSSGLTAASKDKKVGAKSDKIKVTTSIMDIVHETEQLSPVNLAESSSGRRENAAGLRLKKILRRPTEDKESSMLVQNLRKEIRDAVRDKTSKELGDNHFDPKLLAAFRAAVVGQVPESKKSSPVDIKAKKSLLQKGKVRENLTKKIYGMGGRRRRAWNRDCEIEFWKYRCSKVSKPEKIETLRSVLNLLRNSPERTEIEHKNEIAAPSSILSRLYLADSSLFPRKEDIQPMSTIRATATSGQNKDVRSTEKALTSAMGNSSKSLVSNVVTSQAKIPPSNAAAIKCTVPVRKGEVPSSKLNSNRRSVVSTIGASSSQKEPNGKSDDIQSDKRKWAQQFLARKAAAAGDKSPQEQNDNAVLKRQHPLLAQLPRDMRPVLAVSRHNKIPTSVRQAQLHRLTEHFLRKANMSVNRRNAEIELAVADAVNIEKEVADRSNSKLVYVNLCSQELLHRSDNTLSGGAMESNLNPTSEITTNRSIEATCDLPSSLAVDEALRNAGLLSDSPPNSPQHRTEEMEEADNSKKLVQEGPNNVFEIDSEPELDIYGDFEYDLQDEDFIGASTLKCSELQPGEPKLKVVFSTMDFDRPNDALSSEGIIDPAMAIKPGSSSNSLENFANESTGKPNINCKADKFDHQSSMLDESEELSLAECEELYGPDREPIISECTGTVSDKPYESILTPLVPKNSGDNGSNQTLKASNIDKDTLAENSALPTAVCGVEYESKQSQKSITRIEKTDGGKQHDSCETVYKKVEAYIKEHIRPLCKSGVINVEQYRWAVGKTADKIMKYHQKDKNANFLIKEGEKVKKLAEQYVEAAQRA